MYEYDDKELGKIIVKPNIRAKRIIARRKGECIQLTVPLGFKLKSLASILDEMRPRLSKLNFVKNQLITEESILETFSFTARLSRTHLVENVKMRLKNGDLTVFIPSDFDLDNTDSQHVVKEMIRHALRHEAKKILPKKTQEFAQKLNLHVADVKINKSISRWGSCSRKKSINFSLYLLLLPEKYIDYVVLHELAHTIELNHSEKFWKLLDNFCGENAKAISQSLRKHKSTAYELLKP
ncbi:MAG: DUF45 domain-containing protein [Bacteroidia bacterium]|nr:DUF45 domain-containing protein [Bacteroidia bacterium]